MLFGLWRGSGFRANASHWARPSQPEGSGRRTVELGSGELGLDGGSEKCSWSEREASAAHGHTASQTSGTACTCPAQAPLVTSWLWASEQRRELRSEWVRLGRGGGCPSRCAETPGAWRAEAWARKRVTESVRGLTVGSHPSAPDGGWWRACPGGSLWHFPHPSSGVPQNLPCLPFPSLSVLFGDTRGQLDLQTVLVAAESFSFPPSSQNFAWTPECKKLKVETLRVCKRPRSGSWFYRQAPEPRLSKALERPLGL